MRSILLFFIFVPYICWAQSSSEGSPDETQRCQCAAHVAHSDNAAVLWLSEKEMRSHVAHVVPLKFGEPHATANGTLVLSVRFQSDGSVGCVKAISGNPLVIASAMNVVPKWAFRPVEKKGKKFGGCGLLTVKYRIDASKQETTVK